MNGRFLLILFILAVSGICLPGIDAMAGAPPLLSVTPGTIDFGIVPLGERETDSFVVNNSGDSPLQILGITLPGSGEYRLTVPEFPFTLDAHRFIRIPVELRAHDTGCPLERAVIVTSAGRDTVVLTRCVYLEQGMPDYHFTLTFNDTKLNYCSGESAKGQNMQSEALILYSIQSEDAESEVFHSTTVIPYEGLSIDPGASFNLPFDFCPRVQKRYHAKFYCVTNLGVFSIETTGSALQQQAEIPHRYYLDSVSGHVGDIVTMRLLVDPPLADTDKVDSIDLDLSFIRQSLTLEDIELGGELPSHNVLLIRMGGIADTERIQVVAIGEYLAGAELLQLRFRGLSTGRPQNRVRAEGGTSSSETIVSTGMVSLEGCTLGVGGLSRRVSVEALNLDPFGREITLHYTAPQGAGAEAAVIDAMGREVARFRLQPGNDASQQWKLPLAEFTPGLYGLLIEVADDQVIVPFISPR